MAEYIEKTEELILAVNAGARVIENTKRYHGASYCMDVFAENLREIPYLKAAEVLRGFDAIPAADVAPVVRAKWIAVEDPVNTVYDCSACNETFCFIEGDPKENLYSYCPNCGAKMDGSKDATTAKEVNNETT